MKSKVGEQKIYECILILNHNEIENVVTTVTNDLDLDSQEFFILHKETWGKRTLSYKILKNKAGYYFAFYIKATKKALENFNKKLRMHQDIMRFLILVTNDIPERTPPIARNIFEDIVDSQKKHQSISENDEECEDSGWISFKNPVLLIQYISDLYKILPRRFNGLSSTQQRILKREINLARFLAILPFVPVRKK